MADIDDYNINSDETEWAKEVYNTDNLSLMLVTYDITNTSDKDVTTCFKGYSVVTKDFHTSSDNSDWLSEPQYQSEKDNGGKSSYVYTFEVGKTRTITLGYIVPSDVSCSDYYVLAGDDEEPDTAFEVEKLEDGKWSLYSIS